MDKDGKMKWLHAAEVFDAWRVIPRVMVLGYAWFVYHTTELMIVWYNAQPMNGRGTQETAMVIAVTTAVTGFAPWIFKIYSDNGRNWNDVPADAPNKNNG